VRLAEAMRQAVEGLNVSYRHPERGPGRITISAGVVAVGEPSRLADDASDAVYEAKRAGRNRVAARAAGTSTGS
jgi:PleD family two-component response regulator